MVEIKDLALCFPYGSWAFVIAFSPTLNGLLYTESGAGRRLSHSFPSLGRPSKLIAN